MAPANVSQLHYLIDSSSTSEGSPENTPEKTPERTSEAPPKGSKKRSQAAANLDKDGNPKPVRKRASKACMACRGRKVRCDFVQRFHSDAVGDPLCSNCAMDGVPCRVAPSRRRKKQLPNASPQNTEAAPLQVTAMNEAQAWSHGLVDPTNIENPEARRWSSSSAMSNDIVDRDYSTPAHAAHSIYQNLQNMQNMSAQLSNPGEAFSSFHPSSTDPDFLLGSASLHGDRVASRIISEENSGPSLGSATRSLPGYLKALPQRMTSVDIDYLFAKGALTLPKPHIRNALLRGYLEYVHPYMPLLEIHSFLASIEDETGGHGQISLLLFHAVMFAGTPFIDVHLLSQAGYPSRKAARKSFFQKARVLYDADYEIDRVSLIQSLLLMTYWYETPDDQKDTWHWMGVAISLAHTIGLHRDPEQSNMEPSKKKLWKRIWWSCFMRDRLVALGMRRPTRVKDEDYDVPMLTEDDFEVHTISETIQIIPADCTLMRDTTALRELARMCIAKAELCRCISHVLTAQYSVLVKAQGMQGKEGNYRSSVMLYPKKLDETDEVKRCDEELKEWIDNLPRCCVYTNEMTNGESAKPVFVQRSLLHMIYFTTLSALHRPQVLPSASTSSPDKCRALQDLSRKKVREASREITRISHDLHSRSLEIFLPTTGVTVLLPAIIIHLLDIKASNDETRQAAMDGFCQCMQVLEKLRDNYSAADYATQFLEAAIRKADIDIAVGSSGHERDRVGYDDVQATVRSEKLKELRERSKAARRTPPQTVEEVVRQRDLADASIPTTRSDYNDTTSALTPPHSDCVPSSGQTLLPTTDSEVPFEDYLLLDSNEIWTHPLDQGAHGESGGFVGDMNWIGEGTNSWDAGDNHTAHAW